MRRFVHLLVCCVAVSLFASCHRSADVPPVGSGNKQWVNQDFEGLWGWVSSDKAASITQEKAHSGRYSLTVGPGVEYSATFGAPLGQLSDTKPRKINITAWVWVPNAESTAILVVQVGGPQGNVMWDGLRLSNKINTYGKWVQLNEHIMLSPNIAYEHGLSVYLWSQSTPAPVYLDDLVITEAE
ncbi:hypothetical protein [Hymenobacter weizhouensis]|uniref:hypothetical protein n=1 Tax=Hymenobacter sp. YIM 151500-1 TaxID=2987689 RepID=UPI002227C98D|nr:hypothetical protein [Hymenobacter sp. YIM 151500-1]UYZ62082.1 hypothetical protein OIS53_13835 [Hymenobacter sp. YIM 151500-1]